MGKSQQSPIFIVNNIIAQGKSRMFPDAPPQVPPRMKKGKAPAIPEKPAHMRSRAPPPSHAPHRILPSGHTPEGGTEREVLRVLQSSQVDGREVLVAASRAPRERPIERRQRQPAQLLTPTKTSPAPAPPKEQMRVGPPRKQHHPPILLIPRGMLPPVVSYALWAPQREGHSPHRRQMMAKPLPHHHQQQQAKQQPVPPPAPLVSRSGSLTSQGSSGSDSETFPKSVLKKQKRAPVPTRASCREHKKNVTFNAFATVQLMDA